MDVKDMETKHEIPSNKHEQTWINLLYVVWEERYVCWVCMYHLKNTGLSEILILLVESFVLDSYVTKRFNHPHLCGSNRDKSESWFWWSKFHFEWWCLMIFWCFLMVFPRDVPHWVLCLPQGSPRCPWFRIGWATPRMATTREEWEK